MSKFIVLSRATAVAAALAIALPALAQTSQPAPANTAPSVSSTSDKAPAKQTTGEVKSDKGKSHANAKDMKSGDKKDAGHQSAQVPATTNKK
jgi:hypothetical protein